MLSLRPETPCQHRERNSEPPSKMLFFGASKAASAALSRTSRRTAKRPPRMAPTLRRTRSSRPHALMSAVASALPKTVSPMVKTSNLCPTFEATQTLGREAADTTGLGAFDLTRATGVAGFCGAGGDWARAAEARQMRRKAMRKRCMRLPWLRAARLHALRAGRNPAKPNEPGQTKTARHPVPRRAFSLR
jgi:hypothetical protein